MKLAASVLLLVALAYVQADCGCLHCSKHLYVATAPGSPIKVIYRGEPGVPLTFPQAPMPISIPIIPGKPHTVDQIVLQNYNPVFTVGLPAQCERTYDYKIEAPVKLPVPLKNICIPKPIKGVATVDRIVLPAPIIKYQPTQCKTCQRTFQEIRPIRQPIIEQLIPACSSPCASPYYSTYRYVSYDDISTPCITNTPLLDELEVSSEKLALNPFYIFLTKQNKYRSKRSTPQNSPLNACQPDNRNPEENNKDAVIQNYLESFGNNMDVTSDSNIDAKNTVLRPECFATSAKDETKETLTQDTQDNCNTEEDVDPKCRNKRYIPIISTGLNLLSNLLPPFIKFPLQQGLRSVQRGTNQHLAQQRRRRFQEELFAQRQMRRYNPYAGIPSYYQTPKYYPFRHAPLPPPPARRRLHSYYDNDIYADELEQNFISSLTEPTYMPGVYSRTRDDDYDDYDTTPRSKFSRRNDIFSRNMDRSEVTSQEMNSYDSSPRSKYGRRNDLLNRNSDKSELTPYDRNVFLKKLQKLNNRRYRRSLQDHEDIELVDSRSRTKRAIVLDGSELGLPFFRVTKLASNDIEDSSGEYEGDSEEFQSQRFFREDTSDEEMARRILKKKKAKNKDRGEGDGYMNPLDFGNLIPHNPIFYILNTPLRLLNHLHNVREQLSPVLRSVPKVLVSSRRYLQDFGRAFESGFMDFTSNIIGRFDEPHYNYNLHHSIVTPVRYKRSTSENKEKDNYDNKNKHDSNNDENRMTGSNIVLNSTDGSLNNNVTKCVTTQAVNVKIQDISSQASEESRNSGNFYPEYEPVFNHIYGNKANIVKTSLKESNSENGDRKRSSELPKEQVILAGRFFPEYSPAFDRAKIAQNNKITPKSRLVDDGHSSNIILNNFKTYNRDKKQHIINEKKIPHGNNISNIIHKNLTKISRLIANGHYHPDYELFFNTDKAQKANIVASQIEKNKYKVQPTTHVNINEEEIDFTNKNMIPVKTETAINKENPNINQNVNHVRKKRYLLKMVDDSEVHSFIHSTLGQIMAPFYQDSNSDEIVGQSYKKPCKNCYKDYAEHRPSKKPSKKRYVIEKLYPKIIIDNNGRPFLDIDGTKRPLIYNKNKKKCQKPGCHSSGEKREWKKPCKYCGGTDTSQPDSLEQFNFETRISNLIEKAKRHAENPEENQVASVQYSEMPVKTVKEEIKKLLTEIDWLVAMDFEPYLTIYNELLSLEHLKSSVCNEWKQMVMSDRINDMSCKIRLLDDFKNLQAAKDEVVSSIAKVLKCDTNNFIAKKLIKLLVRLQKLQCIIFKAVEDVEEKLKHGSSFEINREIKYIDYLCGLSFIVGRSRHDLEYDLKKERDEAVQEDMNKVERLRELLGMPDDCEEINDLSRLLWERRNLKKLQQDTIDSLNYKIKHKQKIRKELKILFDLLRQIESIDRQEGELLRRTRKRKKYSSGYDYFAPKNEKYYDYVAKKAEAKDKYSSKRGSMKELVGAAPKRTRGASKIFKRHPFKPARVVSNGYSLRGYKFSDAFD